MKKSNGGPKIVIAVCLVILITLTIVAMVVASTQKTSAKSVLDLTLSSLKQQPTIQVNGILTVFDAAKKPFIPAVYFSVSTSPEKATALWKLIPQNNRPEKIKLSGLEALRWKNTLSLNNLNSILATLWPLYKGSSSTPEQIAFFKPPLKKLTGIYVQPVIGKTDYLPRQITLGWFALQGKKTYSVRIALQLSGFISPQKIAPDKNAQTVVKSVTSSQEQTSQQDNFLAQNQPVNSPSAPGRAVDVFGNGGVQSKMVDNLGVSAGRDAQRLNDLKALQTALELYFSDQGAYPSGVGIALGVSGHDCLNSDGWASSADCPYPYMMRVPKDPGSATYVYTQTNLSYYIDAQLEGSQNSLSESIRLTPAGIANR